MTRARHVLMLAALAWLGCRNPVNDARRAALGGEAPGVERGPLHRPGQPCTVCHSAAGGQHPEFSQAGTVFRGPDSREPVAGAIVQMIGADRVPRYFTTNAAGNFYVSNDEWSASFPLWTAIKYPCGDGTFAYVEMETQIFRSTSCADCHTDPIGPSSAGQIYMANHAAELCPP